MSGHLVPLTGIPETSCRDAWAPGQRRHWWMRARRLCSGMVALSGEPLSRVEAVRRLKALEPDLRGMGVSSLHLFGSTARNEAGPHSDVDVFFELLPDAALGFSYFGLGAFIEDKIGRAVDFTTRDGLHEMMRARIEREAVRVF